MKYDEKILNDYAAACSYEGMPEGWDKVIAYKKAQCMDMAERIVNIFEDTLKWASKSKQSEAVLRYKHLNLELTPTPIPADIVAKAKATLEKYKKVPYTTEGTLMERGEFNFNRTKAIDNAKVTLARAEHYKKGGKFASEANLVRVGDIAFASNAFELFMDYMHRIQGRSPFVQTFVVELFSPFLPIFYQIKRFLRPEKDKILIFSGAQLYIKPKRANTVRPYGF